MKKTFKFFICVTMLMVLLCGCGSKNSDLENKKDIIAVAIPPIKTFAEKVCGDKFDVVSIIPPGNSPENYEPTPMEKEIFSDAVIYFSLAVPTEKNNILPFVAEKTEVVSLNTAVNQKYADLKIGENNDPHIWLSPKRAIVMVETICDELSKIDVENKDFYKTNAEKYIAELEKLNDDIMNITDTMRSKKILVFHPAFGYLADDYGLTMYALEQEGKEATPKHIKDMIDFAKKENIKVIFYQSEIDSSQSEAFAEEIGGETVMLSPLAENYIENYENMINTIKEAMN